ncbi:MAG: flagellar type III secretion system protein FlhB [Pseudomonadota bacterium]
MAQQGDDESDKSFEPTQHKLDEARKKGDVARSADLDTAATYGGILIVALAAGASSTDRAGAAMQALLDQPGAIADLIFEGGSGAAALSGLMLAIVLAVVAWFVIPALLVILSNLAQQSLVFAPEKLRPKLSRVNPIQNAKNKYGPTGLFEFAKSLVKLLAFSAVLGVFLVTRLSDMAGSVHAEARMIGALMMDMIVDFMFVVLVVTLAIGAIDFLWQRFDHRRKLRMSYREVREEHKNQEGDPHLKQERRQRGTRMAMDQMMADVPQADVVIVNPTHFAVALKWSRLPGSAPECVAKGQDHVALAIRERAFESGVPVHHDPPTARALFATVEIGQEIAPDHYQTVAAAIRFAETMRRRAKVFS